MKQINHSDEWVSLHAHILTNEDYLITWLLDYGQYEREMWHVIKMLQT